MADNRTIINGSGNAGTDYVVATDEIGGVNWERVKLAWGIDGVAGDVSAVNPLPVVGVFVEDAASAGGEALTLVGAVRQDTLAPSTSLTGDYATLKVNANGALYTETTGALTFAGTMPVIDASGSIDNAGTTRTVKYAIIDAATSGDNTLVPAVASRKIRILSAFLVASAAVTVRFESGAGGTALSGQMVLAANAGFVLPYNPHGWNETAVNTLLNLELSGAISVDGMLTYAEVA